MTKKVVRYLGDCDIILLVDRISGEYYIDTKILSVNRSWISFGNERIQTYKYAVPLEFVSGCYLPKHHLNNGETR